MELTSDESGLRPADYRVRIFLSVDLSGSTAFKASEGGLNRDGGATPRWVTVFQKFYSDFPDRLKSNYQKRASKHTGDVCPELWKAVGDELIFCGRVRNVASAILAVSAFVQTIHDYRRVLYQDARKLDLKGAAWLAAFPEPNRTVPLSRGESDDTYIPLSEALEVLADDRPFDFDYLGKAIDTGFRVARRATPEKFTLSVQLARLLAEAPSGAGFNHSICIEEPSPLKGVNDDHPYPLLYLETSEHFATKKLRRRELQMFNKSQQPRSADLADYLSEYCLVVKTDEIALANDADSQVPELPSSYLSLRARIAEYLKQEAGRVASDADGDVLSHGAPETSHVEQADDLKS